MGKIGERSPDRNSSLGLVFYSNLRFFLFFFFKCLLRPESFKYSECFYKCCEKIDFEICSLLVDESNVFYQLEE